MSNVTLNAVAVITLLIIRFSTFIIQYFYIHVLSLAISPSIPCNIITVSCQWQRSWSVSPFVYNFISRQVLNDNRQFYACYYIEQLRTQLLQNETVLEVEDMGADLLSVNLQRSAVASIAQHAAKPKKWAQLLFRIVTLLSAAAYSSELGSSAGCFYSLYESCQLHARLINR